MDQTYYDFDDLSCDINYRWLQPPQIAYFVTTTDRTGNVNTTPVTLGTLVAAALPRGDKPSEYFFTFSLGKVHLKDEGNEIGVRHGFLNLRATDECVISYIGHSLVHASVVAGLPIPRGISEIDVAGLTPLPSQKVTPPGIAECPVNMEAKIVSSQPIGTYYELYLAQVVAASVDSHRPGVRGGHRQRSSRERRRPTLLRQAGSRENRENRRRDGMRRRLDRQFREVDRWGAAARTHKRFGRLGTPYPQPSMAAKSRSGRERRGQIRADRTAQSPLRTRVEKRIAHLGFQFPAPYSVDMSDLHERTAHGIADALHVRLHECHEFLLYASMLGQAE